MTIPSVAPPLLNVHAVLPVSHANGPGARAVVWVQGCRRRCPGCCNPQTHSHKRRHLIDPRQLAEAVLAVPGIEGLTVSGGEPFEQARAVGELCRRVRHAGLSIMVYTGQTHKRLRTSRSSAVQTLLGQTDILIDGPFVRELADGNHPWRGSSNQRALFLTDRYGPETLLVEPRPHVETLLSTGTVFCVSGFPRPSDLAQLARLLRKKAGIILNPGSVTLP